VSEVHSTGSILVNRLLDITVFCIAFYIVWMLFVVETGVDFLLAMSVYSIVLTVSVSLCQIVSDLVFKSMGGVSRYILANATGIMIGASILLLAQVFVSIDIGIPAVVILSSFIAFFVLGTVSPIVHRGSKAQKPRTQILNRP